MPPLSWETDLFCSSCTSPNSQQVQVVCPDLHLSSQWLVPMAAMTIDQCQFSTNQHAQVDQSPLTSINSISIIFLWVRFGVMPSTLQLPRCCRHQMTQGPSCFCLAKGCHGNGQHKDTSNATLSWQLLLKLLNGNLQPEWETDHIPPLTSYSSTRI